MCRTIKGYVRCLRVTIWVHKHARIGMTSTSHFPGTNAAVTAYDASMFAFKNWSSADSESIPYAMDNTMAPGVLWELSDANSEKNVEHDLQVQLLYEALGFLQQTRQEAMHIFALMAVKALVQSYVQDLVEKSAASLPWGTIGHQRERPFMYPRPGDRDWRSENKLHRGPC